MNRNAKRIPCIVLWLICLPASFYAVCDQTSASQADRDLWDQHGCWEDFFRWEVDNYFVRWADWVPRGFFDACNINLEFPKHWNAAYLVSHTLDDNYNQSFHGTADYRATAEAPNSNYHNWFIHQANDGTTFFGAFSPGTVFTPDRLQTSCLLYDNRNLSPNNNPASRAGDFMHESWHAWLLKYNWDNGECGGHSCSGCPVGSCDYFYFHGISVYEFGDMWQNDGTANRFHSPNQVQVEFLCDVADQSSAPASVRVAARADANARASSRFINGPGYRCGEPRPW
jgi:hypothetical protein